MTHSKAIISIEGQLLGPIDSEVDKDETGLVRVRIGPIRLTHELAEWEKWHSEIGHALARLADGDLPDVNAVSGEHPATGGE